MSRGSREARAPGTRWLAGAPQPGVTPTTSNPSRSAASPSSASIWLKCAIIALALLQGGWLVFDGARALISGDYVTPASGPRAGQLGPWSRIVSALGFEPRSMSIKCLHVFLGAAWLASVILFALRPGAGWWAIFACSVGTLWYLPIGTAVGVIEIVLLLFVPR